MDLSKAFDTIIPELLIAKLHPYGFPAEAHKVLLSYVQERWQRVKINTILVLRLDYYKEFPRISSSSHAI